MGELASSNPGQLTKPESKGSTKASRRWRPGLSERGAFQEALSSDGAWGEPQLQPSLTRVHPPSSFV